MKIEYQVRPVTRYIVTRWHSGPEELGGMVSAGVDCFGEYDHQQCANRVCEALAKQEDGATYTLVPSPPRQGEAGHSLS